MNYYYALNGQQTGPVSEEQLAAMVAAGTVAPDSLVWREGMAEWVPYSSIAGGPALGGVVCGVCHQTFPLDQTIKYGSVHVCAGCKPRFLQGLREGAPVVAGMEFAGVGARFGAKLLDNVLLYVVNLSLGLIIGTRNNPNNPRAALFMIGVGISVGLAYQIIFLGWRGQTLGKMATGVKVVNPDGSKIGYGKATGRALAEILSGCLLSIGYLIALWDDEKRTLHDRIASTRAIKVRKS